jgi:glycosyltransferase involved in cell wall biosynthesis
MNNIKISVIIPTYNRANYLVEAIDSVLKQTYENIEIVVSDNASEDNTKEIMEQYKNNNKVKYFINDENIGMVPNWKKALNDYSTGNFAMILSDDDYLLDTSYIEKAVKSIDKHSTKMVFSDCLEVYESNKRIIDEKLVKYDLPEFNKGEELFFRWRKPHLDRNFFIMLQTVIFDRHIAVNECNAFTNPIISADFQLWFTIFAKGYNASYINVTGAAYRIHSGSETVRHKVNWKGWLDNFDSYLIPEKFAIKIYNKKSVEKHVNWMIRESFKDWPGNMVKLNELNKFIKLLKKYPRLKKEFYKSLLLYPKSVIKLLLSTNGNLYNKIQYLYFKYIKNETLHKK